MFKFIFMFFRWLWVITIKALQKKIFLYQCQKAIDKANHLHKLFGKRYIVLKMHSRPCCVEKQRLKFLITTRYFKKGTTIQEIEKRALYITK